MTPQYGFAIFSIVNAAARPRPAREAKSALILEEDDRLTDAVRKPAGNARHDAAWAAPADGWRKNQEVYCIRRIHFASDCIRPAAGLQSAGFTSVPLSCRKRIT